MIRVRTQLLKSRSRSPKLGQTKAINSSFLAIDVALAGYKLTEGAGESAWIKHWLVAITTTDVPDPSSVMLMSVEVVALLGARSNFNHR